jgi:hypothetical protein
MRLMRGSASGVLFRVIKVALLPVGTIGYLWAVPKLLVFSRRKCVSRPCSLRSTPDTCSTAWGSEPMNQHRGS